MSKNRELTALIVGDVYVRRDEPPSMFQHVKDLLRSAQFGTRLDAHGDSTRVNMELQRAETPKAA
jgi:hypothetical protein